MLRLWDACGFSLVPMSLYLSGGKSATNTAHLFLSAHKSATNSVNIFLCDRKSGPIWTHIEI